MPEQSPGRVAILRALQLGDLLCAVPVFRALRAAWPETAVTLVGLPWARALVERFPAYLDDFLEVPGWPGLPETGPAYDDVPAFLAEARSRQFDLVLQLHGSGGVSNPLAVLLGGRATAGFYLPGQYRPDPTGYIPYPDHGHEIHRLLAVLQPLGVPDRGDYLEFPLAPADFDERASLYAAHGLTPGSYVCLHPGSQLPARRWAPERFARVGDALVERGYRVALTGIAAERPLTAAVAGTMRAPAIDLAGATSLGGVGALLAGARLLVSNDTGVSHVATALRVPSAIVVTVSDPDRWAPLDRVRHVALAQGPETPVEAVLAAAEQALAASAPDYGGREAWRERPARAATAGARS